MRSHRESFPLVILLAGLLSGASCTSPAGDSNELQPQDFATGLEISAPGGQPFFRFDLPDYVFSETAWPDLRDLRVFNAAGETVPFARVQPVASDGKRSRVALRSFRLESMKPGGVPRIELDARERGLELRVAPGATPEAGAEYLLAVVDEALKTPVEKLFLEWEEHTANWQQKVTVSVSSDLDSWRTVAVSRPLMDLKTLDGQRLTHGEIVVERSTPQSARYWRFRFGPGFAPRLTKVEGETTTAAPPPPGIRLMTMNRREPDGSAIYELQSSQPVARIRIIPQDVNSVVPILIEGRNGNDDGWQPLVRTAAYRLTQDGAEQFSDPVNLGGRMLKAIRLRPLNASWGQQIPTAEVERDPVTLIVNARGAGPFLLAWGCRAADDSSVPLTTLVPNLASTEGLDIPGAVPLARQALGGPTRVTSISRAERTARWQTTLVWIMLIGGAGALAFLAFRVWREAK